MYLSFLCVSVFVKGLHRERDRVRETGRMREKEGGAGGFTETEQRQQTAAPSSVTETP